MKPAWWALRTNTECGGVATRSTRPLQFAAGCTTAVRMLAFRACNTSVRSSSRLIATHRARRAVGGVCNGRKVPNRAARTPHAPADNVRARNALWRARFAFCGAQLPHGTINAALRAGGAPCVSWARTTRVRVSSYGHILLVDAIPPCWARSAFRHSPCEAPAARYVEVRALVARGQPLGRRQRPRRRLDSGHKERQAPHRAWHRAYVGPSIKVLCLAICRPNPLWHFAVF